MLWTLTAATIVAVGALTFGLAVPPAAEQAAQSQRQRPGTSLAETRSILAATGSVLMVSCLAYAALGLVYTYLVVDLSSAWHWSNEAVIGFLFLYGIANVTANLVLGRLGDLWGKARAVRVGQVVEFIALLGMAGASLCHRTWVLVLALMIFAVGQAYIPNKAMVSAVAAELRGRSQAWNNASMYAGMMVGSWAASYGYRAFGLSGLSIAAAAVVAFGWSVAGTAGRHMPEPV